MKLNGVASDEGKVFEVTMRDGNYYVDGKRVWVVLDSPSQGTSELRASLKSFTVSLADLNRVRNRNTTTAPATRSAKPKLQAEATPAPELISLDQVPVRELKRELPERAMGVSSAQGQLKLEVLGAVKEGDDWNVVIKYKPSQGNPKQVKTLLKVTPAGAELMIALDTVGNGSFGDYRDIYIKYLR